MFRTETHNFLQRLTDMRNSEVEKAVAVAVDEEHEPFLKQLNDKKESVIATETERKNRMIAKICEDFEAFTKQVEADANASAEKHLAEVIEKAKTKASKTIDEFILQVSMLADKTKI